MSVAHTLYKNINDDILFINYDRARCEKSFAYFLEQAWPYIDSSSNFIPGWHIDAICEHMQAVKDGEIRRIIVNQPPRTSKSSIISIAFPAWIWTQKERDNISGAQTQIMCGTYAQELSNSMSEKFMSLITSDWYQDRWGHRFGLTRKKIIRIQNNKGGIRQATSVGGVSTGFGGNLIILDDPHNAKKVESKVERQGVLNWYDGALSSRFNNAKNGALILVMQRLHCNDLTGHFLSKNWPDLVHLFLPMEYMPDRKCYTSIGWCDPRTEKGELLAPQRMGPEEISMFKEDLGKDRYAGQHQQMPVVAGGGILKEIYWAEWIDVETTIDARSGKERVRVNLPSLDLIVASLDTAYTTKQENDYSACTIWGTFKDKNGITRVLLIGAWQERLEFHDLVEKVRRTIQAYSVDRILVEAKASGLSVIQELSRLLINTPCIIDPVNPGSLDKVARAYAVSSIFEAGYVYAPIIDWADKVVSECANFPKGAHDDLADSVTQAIKYLRDTIIETREDRQVALQAALTYTKPRMTRKEHGI